MITDEIQFLVAAFVLLSGILLILLIYLICRKGFENRQRRRIKHFKSEMNDKLLHSVLTGEFLRSLQADTKVKKLALEELLSHYAEILEGTEEKNNLNRLAESRLTDYYRKNLSSLRWSSRMNVLFHIEAFQMEGLKGDIISMLNRRRISKDEKIRALTILAQLQSAEMFDLLIGNYKDLSYLEYRNVLSRLNGDSFDQFLLGYHTCQPELKFAIMDIAGLRKELKYLNFTETVFSVSSGEERVRALKAIVSIGHVKKLDPYLHLFQSGNWEERMLAARLAGVLKAEKTLPDLVHLLQDSSWWVRSQAGQSITMFPQGKKVLEDVMSDSKDSFARDMAWEWINKGVYQT